MKKIVLTTLTIVMISMANSAFAWTKKDTAFELAYLAAHVADWGQTLDIASQCASGAYTETNVVMGSCPSSQKVNAYFLGTALLHAGVAHMLPKKYRRAFQTSTIAMEVGFITNNAKIGLSMKF